MSDIELYFRFKCLKGLVQRGLASDKTYIDQLNYEMGIIIQMGYPGYFLIVSDILEWARDQGIMTGVGRGSAAGALVSYVLYITHLDPIKYKLVFERFINPERVSMPDIDMDIEEEKRHLVVEHIVELYGQDKVAHIGAYGSMKARAAIRDVARAKGYPYELGDKLAKLVLLPIEGKAQPLATCYEQVPELRNARNNGAEEQDILSWAEKLENRIRSFSQHPSGIVISDTPIAELIPLYPGKDKSPTTQFEMYTVEDVGLIKFDFLGLSALSTIRKCVELIEARHQVNIDPLNLPVDDEATFKLLQAGHVEGIFQLEGSPSLKDLIVNIRPQKLEDISTALAIFRPGPLRSGRLQQYLSVRAGETTPSYLVPELKPILEETDGWMLLQEQTLRIARDLAGYTLGQADGLRKAIGKKKEDLMQKEEFRFKSGMAANGFEKDIADALWDEIKGNASYQFNKAHSLCYAYISYQMAYLKAHYPTEFMCASLITDAQNQDKVTRYINECKAMEIKILPPSVNRSGLDFTVTGDKEIRFGLLAIKNLGKSIEKIIPAREIGSFKSLEDFVSRVNTSIINRRKLESLILCGAFDDLPGFASRSSLLKGVEDLYQHIDEFSRYEKKLETYKKRLEKFEERCQQIDAYEALEPAERKGKKRPSFIKRPEAPEAPAKPFLQDMPELSQQEILQHERELLGFYLSGHPLDTVIVPDSHSIAWVQEHGCKDQRVKLAVVTSMVREITTKRTKRKMAYLVLEDKTATIEATLMPDRYAEYAKYCEIGRPILCQASIELTENDEAKVVKLMVQKIFPIAQPVITTTPIVVSAKPVTVPIETAVNCLKQQELPRTGEVIITGLRSGSLALKYRRS